MKKRLRPLLLLLLCLALPMLDAFPCPSDCICKPTMMNDVAFTRMSYLIDCRNVSLPESRLTFQAQSWSIDADRISNDEDDDNPTNDYVISIDLSDSVSLKKFTDRSIELTGFNYILQSLSLTSQSQQFLLSSNAFNTPMYKHVKTLNLSSCCKQVPNQCAQLFSPLKNLELLDLSNSDLYKTCLQTPGAISSSLQSLSLRNNTYAANTFSHTSTLFDGVREISGHLDLQNSRFQFGAQLKGNCLFDLFQQLNSVDLSNARFESESNDTETDLAHLLRCKKQTDGTYRGRQLTGLYLRGLKLQRLPKWFSMEHFPQLSLLDLSNNDFRTIDLQSLEVLRSISLAFNPLDFSAILWRSITIYKSINLRSTARNRRFDLSSRLQSLARFSSNIDYSDNQPSTSVSLVNLPTADDFASSEAYLNLSRTNLNSFEVSWTGLRGLDVSGNILTELKLEEQSKLVYLDCSDQQLTSLTLNADSTDLNQLKCANNSLTGIENFISSQMSSLRSIDLSRNLLDSLEKLFANLSSPYLHTIRLQWNRIKIVPSKLFHSRLISLYEINLSWNRIQTIEKHAFQSPNLQILDLTGNALKSVEPKSILTASLRLFFLFNQTEHFIDRCQQSTSNDNLLLIYVSWFEQNGTYMKSQQRERSEQIQLNQCSKRSSQPTKTKWIINKGKKFFSYYFLYLTLGTVGITLIFAAIYMYRRNTFAVITRFQRYKRLDRDQLIENAEEMYQHGLDDDEIVMNLEHPPYRTLSRVPTRI